MDIMRLEDKLRLSIKDPEQTDRLMVSVVEFINQTLDKARRNGAELVQFQYINIPEKLHNTDMTTPDIEAVAYRGLSPQIPFPHSWDKPTT